MRIFSAKNIQQCPNCGEMKPTNATPRQIEEGDWECTECYNRSGKSREDDKSIERGQKQISKYDSEYEFLVKLVQLVTKEGVPPQEIKDLANMYPFQTVDDIGDLTAKIWSLATQKYNIPAEWLTKKLPKNASLKIAMSVIRLTTRNGQELRIYKDPTPQQIENLVANVIKGEVRMFEYEGHTYVWNASQAIHVQVAKLLGLDLDRLQESSFEFVYPGQRWDERDKMWLDKEDFDRIQLRRNKNKKADLWPAQEQAEDMLSHEHNSLSYNNDQEPDTSVSGPRPDDPKPESVWDLIVDKFFKNHESWSDVVKAIQQANPEITNDDINLLKEKVKQTLDKQMNFTAARKKSLNIDKIVQMLNAKEPKVVSINMADKTLQLVDDTTISFDDAVKMAMEIDKTGVFSGAEFSTTDFNTNPTLDNGPFSSPEDHGAKPQKQPFPNTDWVPADDTNEDEEPYSDVASNLNRPFSKKATMYASAWIDPSGKIFSFSDNTHDTWIETNAEMLKNQYNIDLSQMNAKTDSSVSYMIENDWTRAAVADTAIVFNTKDIGHVDQLDGYIAQNWKPNFQYVLIETFSGNYVVNDPFPTLSKGIQKSKRMGKQASVDGQAINNILHNITSTGGTTYNLFTGDLAGTQNYAVSIYPDREQVVEGVDFDVLEGYVEANEDLLSDSKNSFAAWSNVGKVYLDVVTTVPDRDQAVELARENNQIVIWDLQNNKEISTGGTGGSNTRAFSKKSLVKFADQNVLCQEDQNEIAAASSPAYVIAVNNYAEAVNRGHNKDRSLEYAIESVANLEKLDAKKLVEFINNYVI